MVARAAAVVVRACTDVVSELTGPVATLSRAAAVVVERVSPVAAAASMLAAEVVRAPVMPPVLVLAPLPVLVLAGRLHVPAFTSQTVPEGQQ